MEGSELAGQIDQLKKLWMLDLVVQLGSFQKAASQAKVTRSAISQTISHLEQLHGKSLLIRERGGVQATPYCLEILEQVRPVLSSLKSLQPLGKETGKIPKMSWLDIGAFESLAISIMPGLMVSLKEKCPGIRIKVKVGRSGALASLVRKGELCMAIVIENDLLNGLLVTPLATDRLGLFVSASLPKGLKSIEAIEKIPVGALATGPDGVPSYFAKFMKAMDLNKRISFSSDSLEAILAVTLHGTIAGILPARVAQRAGDALVEITPKNLIEKQLGLHKICLISAKNCDLKENDFLAEEIRILL